MYPWSHERHFLLGKLDAIMFPLPQQSEHTMTVGRPSPLAQAGELESAREWIRTAYDRNWSGVSLYDELFPIQALDYSQTKVLDVGAGPISVFEPVAPEGAMVVPYDTLAREYNELLPDKKFAIRDSFPEGQFDVVAVLNCLDHMEEPEALLEAVHDKVDDRGRLWLSVHLGQPYEPELHPQNFDFWTLIAMTERHFRILDCGLTREGPLYPYVWWAICDKVERRRTGATYRWNVKCAISYARFHAVRAFVKLIRTVGLRAFLSEPLRG